MPENQVGIAESDLRLLYARINAHEAMIRALIRSVANSTRNPAKMLEKVRTLAMEEGDNFMRRPDDPNPEFTKQGMLETLQFIANTLAHVKGTSG